MRVSAVLFFTAVLLSSLVVASPALAQPLQKPLAEAVGEKAPASTETLKDALAAQRTVVLMFDGDGGPDLVHQSVIWTSLRGEYLGRANFVRATEGSPDGDKVFEEYGATRIPTTVVISADGVIRAVFEGFAPDTKIRAAINEAIRATGGVRPTRATEGTPRVTSAAPRSLLLSVGLTAKAATQAIADALNSGKPTLLFFHAEWSKFSRQQAGIVEGLDIAFGDKVNLLTLAEGAAADKKAMADYGVQCFPTLVVIGADSRVRNVFPSLTEIGVLRTALDAALASAPIEAPTPVPAPGPVILPPPTVGPAPAPGPAPTPAPGGGPRDLLGKPAPVSTQIINFALATKQPLLMFFYNPDVEAAVDQQAVIAAVKVQFAGKMNTVTLNQGSELSAQAFTDYKVTEVPTIVIVDKEGKVAAVHVGKTDESALVTSLNGVVGQ